MAYLAPCLNCAADKTECPRRQAMNKAIKGLGITSAKFNCPDRKSKFRPGQRVEFFWRYWEQTDDHGGSDEFIATFTGTIMREKPNNRRFSIRVDQDGDYYDLKPSEVLKNAEFTSVRPDDIRPLDEPDYAICPNCAAYDDPLDPMRAACWADGPYVPKGCHSA
jgi:hypothetical protein